MGYAPLKGETLRKFLVLARCDRLQVNNACERTLNWRGDCGRELAISVNQSLSLLRRRIISILATKRIAAGCAIGYVPLVALNELVSS